MSVSMSSGCGRSSGRFARSFANTAFQALPDGSPGTGGTGAARCFWRVSLSSAPTNGGAPASSR